MWQVQHYLRSTADAELAREILPVMRRLVDAFWKYEDLDDNRLPGFGVQVLTQEDYIATPRDGTSSAVVGVEMWRTLSLVERLAGNEEQAEMCERRAAAVAASWRSNLWLPELGRPAYYRDQLSQVRPDGQYHTLVLPVVYGLLHGTDAYTTIRHMTDRLVGPLGELYYSNNFANHISGARSSPFSPTWGMQAGAYMQPWAAWAYNRLGACNEAVRSLDVVARWAIMDPHRDAWPESSTEITPAYFSNTAANYAQAVIEALFGLQLDAATNTLSVQPAFPDGWDRASIQLAAVHAQYEHLGNTFRYKITTESPRRRHLRWPLPVCAVQKVEVNGSPCEFTTEEGIGGIWLNLSTEPLTETDIVFTIAPVEWSVSHAKSIAEGETMDVAVEGCRALTTEDPTRCVAATSLQQNSVRIRLASNQVGPWLRFGRLGQLNFSRRTVFLRCEAGHQTFLAPIDFTVLPPFEAAAAEDLMPADGGHDLCIALRNNTSQALAGTVHAHWAAREIPVKVSVAPRSDVTVRLSTTAEDLRQLTPGDNRLRLSLPSGQELEVPCPVARPFQDDSHEITAACRSVPLPESELVADEAWREFAAFPVFWQSPYNTLPRPMDSLRDTKSVCCDAIPGVEFQLAAEGRLAVASRRLGREVVTVPVGATFRKMYLLVAPFVENHDVFTQCARITVTCQADFERPPFDGTEEPVQWTRARYPRLVIQRQLFTPGDLDSWLPEREVGPLATARLERPNRYGLLSLLGANEGDWTEGRPLANPYGMFAMLEPPPRDKWPEGTFRSFPQPQFWASCPAIRTPSATFNVVEIDLDRERHVVSIELNCPLQDAAIGLVSVVGITSP